MRRLVSLTAVALAAAGASAAQAGDINFGVTITGEVMPGVYGHVVVGNAPPPPIVYAQPMVIAPPPPGIVYQPIYLHVPPEHARHWREHCREYHACNRPVYFVRSEEYAPGFDMERWRREHPGRGHWDRDRRWERDDRGDRDHHGDRGYDRGHRDHEDHDRGHGRGHDDHRD